MNKLVQVKPTCVVLLTVGFYPKKANEMVDISYIVDALTNLKRQASQPSLRPHTTISTIVHIAMDELYKQCTTLCDNDCNVLWSCQTTLGITDRIQSIVPTVTCIVDENESGELQFVDFATEQEEHFISQAELLHQIEQCIMDVVGDKYDVLIDDYSIIDTPQTFASRAKAYPHTIKRS